MDDALREALERADRLEGMADRLAEKLVEADDLIASQRRQIRDLEARLRWHIGRPS